MTTTAIKRIINKDIKEINSKNLNSLGIYIQFNEENLLEAKAMIVGPKDSLYESGFLLFNITFPKNYPHSPPDLYYISRNKIRIHPNIYVGGHSSGKGKVCLSILGTWSGPKWTSIMDITTVLLTLQSLLDNNPLHHEPGQENNFSRTNELYNKVIEYESFNTLLLRNFLDIPNNYDCFYENMKNEIDKNKDNIKNKIDRLKKEKDKNIEMGFYRISAKLNYSQLLENINKLLN
jgi:ubiquitin-protein ligase